ncbi:MAG: helix-turn-helix domain-containing protein [Archaeoglobaceae archaeon]
MNLVEALKTFGLSEYEARALIALLSRGSMTAREISEVSGIPRTSVYDVMNSLMMRGLVESFGKPVRFKALPADEIIKILTRKTQETLEFVKRELPKFQSAEVDVIRIFRGELVLEKLKSLVRNANNIVAVLSYLPKEVADVLRSSRAKVLLVSSNASQHCRNDWECYEFKKKDEIVEWAREHGEVCHGVVLIDEKVTFAIFISRNLKVGIISEGSGILEFTKHLITPLIEFLRR